ncbi:MAG: DUF4159 domain-containing protein [Planctomycetota bacterium]
MSYARPWVRCVFGVSLALLVLADGWVMGASCGPPPPAAPQRRTGGESFPPLPLPATPLRRSERKRPPAPPALISKVAYGKMAKDEATGKMYRDWTTDPGDVQTLLGWVNNNLKINYRAIDSDFSQESFNPAEIPILYLTGHEGFEFTDEIRAKVARFVMDGGYVLGDACCGSAPFAESFRAEVQKIFPNRPFFRLEADDPIYSAYYKIGQVTYQVEGKGTRKGAPELYGMNVGCRTAVVLTQYDLSCGWSGHTHGHGARVLPEDAVKLGANLITYMLANYGLGRATASEKVYYQTDAAERDEFVIAQLMHEGDWDPHPSGVVNLLRYLDKNSTMDLLFKRATIRATEADAFRYPVLYMTGHRPFTWTPEERQALRRYFLEGGLLFANACCGRQSFDAAFRRELGGVLEGTGAGLEAVAPGHPLYNSLFTIEKVRYTRALLVTQPGLNAPVLEGVTLEGRLVVIYSKYGLGESWEEVERPYALAYEGDSALKIGMNCVVYALTH